MDNLELNSKEQTVEDHQLADTNKRKRRHSLNQSDEFTKKKVLHTEIFEYDEASSSTITKDTENDSCNDIQPEDEFNDYFLIEDLCDEILYEIFKFLDTWSLMSLMNVCTRFQKFILDKRLWENIDLSQQPLPLGILEDKLERSHDRTKCIKLRGPSPCQHIEGEIQHFNKTIQSSLTTRCTKLITLELYGVTLDFNQVNLKDFPQTLKRLVLNTCNVRAANYKSLFTGIDTILINLEELAIEFNSWFDPYYVMALSKLPLLRYLSLRACSEMHHFIPYGSIAARQGFKKLEVLDLRDTPLNDSDLQCFNAVETLKEIYLQCPEYGAESSALNKQPSSENSMNSSAKESPTCSQNENTISPPSSSPSTSKSATKGEKSETSALLSPSSESPPASSRVSDNNAAGSAPIIVHLARTNDPSRSSLLLRADRPSINPLQLNDHENYARPLQLSGQIPVIQQVMRHNLFWDIVNPLGGIVVSLAGNRVFGGENDADHNTTPSSRQPSHATITNRGVCCFGRTRQPVQQGIVWIRYNNHPSDNRFERFSVRDYKFVTDVFFDHLVQCSPHLIFLDVSGTSVTLKGVQRFKEQKPECKVVAEHLLGGVKQVP